MFVRRSNSNHVKVLIDATDPSNPTRHVQGARRVAYGQARYLRAEIIEASAGDDEEAVAEVDT